MTAFSCSTSPNEYHDTRLSSSIQRIKNMDNFQYQILPVPRFSTRLMQKVISDLNTAKAENSIISFSISNTMFRDYLSLGPLYRDVDELIVATNVKRLDFDLSPFSNDPLVLTKIIKLLNKLQKKHEYNLSISLTFAVDIKFGLSDQSIRLIDIFLKELINISMIKIIINKTSKRRSVSWLDTVKVIKAKVRSQLATEFQDHFFGNIEQHMGFSLCLASYDENHPLLYSSSDKITASEFHKLWTYCNTEGIALLQMYLYLTNTNGMVGLIMKQLHELTNNETIPLPSERLIQSQFLLPHEVSFLESQQPEGRIEDLEAAVNSLSAVRYRHAENRDLLPTYESVINQHGFIEGFGSHLGRIPSYQTLDSV